MMTAHVKYDGEPPTATLNKKACTIRNKKTGRQVVTDFMAHCNTMGSLPLVADWS